MNFDDLLKFLESLVESILTNDSEKVIKYVDSIRSKHPHLTENQIAKKIVGEQSFINGLLGAATGAAGLMALPATVPTDLVKAWRIQAFTIRCIAYSYGYTDQNTDLKTDIYLLLSNNSMATLKQMMIQEAAERAMGAAVAAEALKKSVTIEAAKAAPKYAAKVFVNCVGKEAANYTMKGLPKHITKAIWKIGGRKIVEKSIQKSLAKVVPVVGAVTGFAFDWVSTKVVGDLAIEFYQNSGPEFLDQLFNS